MQVIQVILWLVFNIQPPSSVHWATRCRTPEEVSSCVHGNICGDTCKLNVEDIWLDNHNSHDRPSKLLGFKDKAAHIMTHPCLGNSTHL